MQFLPTINSTPIRRKAESERLKHDRKVMISVELSSGAETTKFKNMKSLRGPEPDLLISA